MRGYLGATTLRVDAGDRLVFARATTTTLFDLYLPSLSPSPYPPPPPCPSHSGPSARPGWPSSSPRGCVAVSGSGRRRSGASHAAASPPAPHLPARPPEGTDLPEHHPNRPWPSSYLPCPSRSPRPRPRRRPTLPRARPRSRPPASSSSALCRRRPAAAPTPSRPCPSRRRRRPACPRQSRAAAASGASSSTRRS